MNEQVMVVARDEIRSFVDPHPYDLVRDGSILEVISRKHFFIDRPTAETSPQFKQIIPYVVLRHVDDFYLLRRTTKQTEARLHHKLSLGIGGHINPDTPTLLGGLRKELEEEVAVAEPYDLSFVGILNDDSTDVGRVHLGAVYLLEPASPVVTVRETEKMTGSWAPRAALAPLREAMETWSQIVYDRFIVST
jgi:predicted NUDIX family phosphoesterase